MNRRLLESNGDGLEATRAAMRRDLNRANTSVGIILVVVFGLAVAAVFAGMRASKNFGRAVAAEAEGRDRLWNSYLAQTRAVRLTPEAGRCEKIFNVLTNAAAIHKNAALCSEAIASLALSDIETGLPLQNIEKSFNQMVEMDNELAHFAYGSPAGEVFVGDIQTGKILQVLQASALGAGTRLPVRSVVFSPDGSKIAARFAGGAMVLWDLATQQTLITSGLAATNQVIAGMSFWADGSKFSFGDADAEGKITVFDFSLKTRVNSAIHVATRPFRFRPDTMDVAIAGDNEVAIFQYPSETAQWTLPTPNRIYSLAWSPDGTQLAIALEDGDIYLWDVVHKSQRVLRGHSEPCTRLVFSPNGRLLASGSRDGTTRLWDVVEGQTEVVATEGIVCAISPDGKRIGYWKLSAGYGVWKYVDSACYDLLVCPKSEGAFLSVDLSPSGRWCIATQTKGVRIWDLKNDARETFVPGAELVSARITADERAIYVCSSQTLERWPIQIANDGGLKIDLTAKKILPLPDGKGARGIALSLDGKWAVVELSDLRLEIFNLVTNAPAVFLAESSRQPSLRTPGSPTGAGRFAISPDGRWVVTGFGIGPDDKPMVWDAQTGKLETALPFSSAVVVFSPDGQQLGTAGTANFAIWSVGDWQLRKKFDRDERGVSQGSMAFIQGSDEIAVTRTRQLAQLRSGTTNVAFTDLIAPQPQSVNSLRMSLDGSVMVTASATDKLQVWYLNALRERLKPLGLDWRQVPPVTPSTLRTKLQESSPVEITLIVSLAGFALAALFALASLRRHREAIAAYLAAETKTAQRNREFEIAKMELMHSQKMQALGTLAAGIAHDFNNLLSVIRMSGKLIGREARGHAEIQECVADIEQAVIQGKHVVGSMLGYARNETAANGPTDMSTVVEETVSLLSKEFLSGIALTLELDRDAPKVNVSRGRLEQVLLNLIVNAAEAMQGQGKLKISLRSLQDMPARRYALRPAEADRFIEMAVADTGPGIAAENQLRIFEPFFTTKRTGAKAGTGLGLSLVYSIAEQDGLGLSVHSEAERGTTFFILVPIATPPPVRETHTSQNVNAA